MSLYIKGDGWDFPEHTNDEWYFIVRNHIKEKNELKKEIELLNKRIDYLTDEKKYVKIPYENVVSFEHNGYSSLCEQTLSLEIKDGFNLSYELQDYYKKRS